VYENQKKQTPDAFLEALQENIHGSRHAIKFIAQFASALLKTRTSNLTKIANAIETIVASSLNAGKKTLMLSFLRIFIVEVK
jgi:hypothetical protein